MKTDNEEGHVNESLPILLEECKAGKGAAIAELIRRFRPRALELAAALLDDRDMAEDAVQEAFLSALNELSNLREPEAFPAWFRQIIRTRCNRITRRPKEVPVGDEIDPPQTTESPARHVELEELRARVRKAMDDLPPAQRETAEMFYLDEQSCAGIADLLQLPSGTVRRRLHDARRRLRGMLLGYIGADPQEKHPQ